jgi:hypothetical protein
MRVIVCSACAKCGEGPAVWNESLPHAQRKESVTASLHASDREVNDQVM